MSKTQEALLQMTLQYKSCKWFFVTFRSLYKYNLSEILKDLPPIPSFPTFLMDEK
jgi:hypothetical protein